MKKINFFIIGMISLLILIGFVFDYFTNYPIFPQNYDNYTFLLSVFNILFGGTFIFGIYRWNIEQENQKISHIKEILFGITDRVQENIFHFMSTDEYKEINLIINSYTCTPRKNTILDIGSINTKVENIIMESAQYYKLINSTYELVNIFNEYKVIINKKEDLLFHLKIKMKGIGNIEFYYLCFIYKYAKINGNIHISDNILDYGQSIEIQKLVNNVENLDEIFK